MKELKETHRDWAHFCLLASESRNQELDQVLKAVFDSSALLRHRKIKMLSSGRLDSDGRYRDCFRVIYSFLNIHF